MVKIKTKQTAFRLPLILLESFRKKADKEYKTMTAKVIELMVDYVKAQEK